MRFKTHCFLLLVKRRSMELRRKLELRQKGIKNNSSKLSVATLGDKISDYCC